MTKHHRPTRRGAVGGHSGLPIVAIVGRPNVGKSTLFNRLARRSLAIVHDESGVTRDRHYTDTEAFGTRYTLVDTGGFDPDDDDSMRAGIARHVRAAVLEADVVIFVSDATVSPTPADRAAIELLRRWGKPVFYAANKVDSPAREADAFELYRLGVPRVFPISSLHGRGVGELEAAVVQALPVRAPSPDDPSLLRIAIVGRPNAGKSRLLNRLVGEERMLVDERPGTTRDSIDTAVEHAGRTLVFVDTAGIRRKAKVAKAGDDVESMSVVSAIRAIERSQLVVLLCDAKEGVAEQDAKILGLAEDRGRAVVIGLNKSDLLSRGDDKKAVEGAREKLSFAPWAPVVLLSAKTGRGVADFLGAALHVAENYVRRVGTGELNRFFEQVLELRSPPTMGGRAPRIYFITQAETAPPLFVAVTNAPDSVHFSYRRFVTNQLRQRFDFEGVPIRVVYKAKRRRGDPKGTGAPSAG